MGTKLMLTTLEQNLQELSDLKVTIDAGREARLRFDTVKAEVATELLATQSDKTKPFAGVYALISRKQVAWVSDSEALLDWFIANGYPEHDYMTDPEPDIAKIEQVAADVLEESGEIIPGLSVRVQETVSVRSAKEARK